MACIEECPCLEHILAPPASRQPEGLEVAGTGPGAAAAAGASTIEPAAAAAMSGAIKRATMVMVGTFFLSWRPSGFHRCGPILTTLAIREFKIMKYITHA